MRAPEYGERAALRVEGMVPSHCLGDQPGAEQSRASENARFGRLEERSWHLAGFHRLTQNEALPLWVSYSVSAADEVCKHLFTL